MRRALGFPRLERRTWLLLLLVFLGVLCVGTWVAEFATKLGQYAPQGYEPKDFARQRALETPTERKR